jgi:cytosine/adenosine deaminase-related metal-dependent hydrolase
VNPQPPPPPSNHVPFTLCTDVWSAAPAAVVGLGAKGAIAPGKDADFVVWDPEADVTVGGEPGGRDLPKMPCSDANESA